MKNLEHCVKHIHQADEDITLTTDSSISGWRAKTNMGGMSQGMWYMQEQEKHISLSLRCANKLQGLYKPFQTNIFELSQTLPR